MKLFELCLKSAGWGQSKYGSKLDHLLHQTELPGKDRYAQWALFTFDLSIGLTEIMYVQS